MTLALRYAARSDVGLLREGNEDSAYAGPHLLAVADGMGGHAHGEVASAATIATLAPLDHGAYESDPVPALGDAVRRANVELRRMVEGDAELEGMGTTLTALLWLSDRVALGHIGDSRGYLLRDGELQRLTRDHTLVQSLIDEGRIDEEEAAVHPQRSLLLRALDGRTEVEPDVTTLEVRSGDRYLLCSDGLSSVVSEDTLGETVRAGWDPERVVQQLIELANRGGGPDNITCVVADVVESAEEGADQIIAGAAASAVQRSDDTLTMDTSAGRAAQLMRSPAEGAGDDSGGGGRGDEGRGRRSRPRWPKIFLSVVIIVVAAGGALFGGWSYARSQYYVGAHNGEVVIFRGLSQHVAGQNLSRVHDRTGLEVDQLPRYERASVAGNIAADDLGGARQIVARLRTEAQACAKRQQQEQQRESQKKQGGGRKGHDKSNKPGRQDQRGPRHKNGGSGKEGDHGKDRGRRTKPSDKGGGQQSTILAEGRSASTGPTRGSATRGGSAPSPDATTQTCVGGGDSVQ